MVDEIKTGVALLNYVGENAKIVEDLSSALNEVFDAMEKYNGSYVGQADSVMSGYLSLLYHHIEKMIFLHGNLGSYIYGAYEKMECKDEALAQWVISNCEIKEG